MMLPNLDQLELPPLGALDGESYHELSIVIRRAGAQSTMYCLRSEWATSTAGRLVSAQTIIESQQQQIELLAARLTELQRQMAAAQHDPAPSWRVEELTRAAVALSAENDDLRRQLQSGPPAPEVAPAPSASPEAAAAMPDAAAWVCRECGREFASKLALMGHSRSHNATSTKRFPCSEPGCGAVLHSPQGLSAHRRSHWRQQRDVNHGSQPERLPADLVLPFRCAECGSDAFSSDLHQPELCVRCAQAQRKAA